MRDCLRNLETVYYALLTGTTDVTDSAGYRSGEKAKTYDTPVAIKANVSPANGYASSAVFGKDLEYSRTVLTCDTSCPIDEYAVLWIGIEPTDDNDDDVPYNYVVTGVAKGMDNIVYAVREVNRAYG